MSHLVSDSLLKFDLGVFLSHKLGALLHHGRKTSWSGFSWLVVQVVALPHAKRSEFDKNTPDEFEGTKGNAEHVLGGVQWVTLCNLSTNFNHGNLDHECKQGNENKNAVSEDSSENIEFSKFEKSSI